MGPSRAAGSTPRRPDLEWDLGVLVHGTEDPLVPRALSETLTAALTEAGVPGRLPAGHGVLAIGWRYVAPAVLDRLPVDGVRRRQFHVLGPHAVLVALLLALLVVGALSWAFVLP